MHHVGPAVRGVKGSARKAADQVARKTQKSCPPRKSAVMRPIGHAFPALPPDYPDSSETSLLSEFQPEDKLASVLRNWSV